MLKTFYTRKLSTDDQVIDHVRAWMKVNPMPLHLYSGYPAVCTALFWKARENHTGHIKSACDLIPIMNDLSQLSSIDIHPGAKISMIHTNLRGTQLNVWGWLEPKTITAVEYSDDCIMKIEFNDDPSDIWPKYDNAEYGGYNLVDTMVFRDYESADMALVTLLMHTPSNLKIINILPKVEEIELC